jgi:predicted RNA-binding Zn ribbon-like protein
MDDASYLAVALRLVNARLNGIDDLRAALHEEPWWSRRVTDADLRALRGVAAGLRRALDAAVSADPDGVLRETNALLAAHPLRPTLSAGHDESAAHWHVHVADPQAPPATEVAAAACWGLAQAVVTNGLSRWGRCAADNCRNYFLDTSFNRAKRFCSVRCANRVHVAAFRSRKARLTPA